MRGTVPVSRLLQSAQAANLDSAVTAALLLLPAAFSSVDLFRVICGLSYMADIRMAFAEDSRKVGTTVLTQLQIASVDCRAGALAEIASTAIVSIPWREFR